MKSMKIAGLCLVAMLVMSLAMAATASAVPHWEACEKGVAGTKFATGQCEEASAGGEWAWVEIKGTEKSVGLGSLTLKDESIVTVEVGCTVKYEGSLGPGRFGRIEKAAYECKAGKNCEKFEKIEAKHLPWQEELFETEGKKSDKLTNGKAEPEEPVLSVTCKVLGATLTDEINVEKVAQPLEDRRSFRFSTLSFELLVLRDPSDPHSLLGSEGLLRANGNGLRVA